MSRIHRCLSSLLVSALALVMFLPGMKVNAAGTITGECGANVRWSLDNGEMHISGSGDMNGYPVYNNPNSSLCMPWYDYKDQITSVVVDEGVTSIGTSAFWGCKNLKTLQTPASLNEIGFAAFAECTSLTDITIKSGIIGESAFIYDGALVNVNIGDKVTAMGISAFELCEAIQKVNITSLESWCKINFGGIASNPTCKSHKLYLNGSLVTSLTIPDGITEISAHAFEYLGDITSVTLPTSVKSIGEYAFFACTGINKISLNDGLQSIGAQCFNGCCSVFELNIPSSVSFIGNYACAYLPIGTASVNQGVIAKYAFYGCGAMGSVSLGSGITKICTGAFDNCPALNSVVYGGSCEQWNSLEIEDSNNPLINATNKTFNGTGTVSSPALTGFYVGKVFEFGSYEQDGNTSSAEPLNWIVLKRDGDKALVITEKVLEFRRFQSTIMELDTPWESSEIREWLNKDFMNTAFTADEKNHVIQTTLKNAGNERFAVPGTADTQDKVFLLSAEEAKSLFTDDSMRAASCTEYALAGTNEPAFRDVNTGYSYWWLRTAGVNKYSAMFVDYNGVPLEFGMATANYIGGIRPAMWIDVSGLAYTDPEPNNGGNGGVEPTPTTPAGGTITPVPLPTMPAAEMNVGDFVNRCYDVALSRSADAAGYEYWVSKLNNGQACGAQVGYGFIFGDEYKNKNTTDEQFVTDLYNMYFGRTPDEAGFNYWLNMLKEGESRENIFAGFANSLEFFNLCGKYGVVSGVYVVGVLNDQQGGVNSFVARLYKVCFGRLPDQAGQATWSQALMEGKISGSGCAYGFIFSNEFANRNLDDVAFVSYMYQAFFGREADVDGLTAWVQQLNNGATREDVYDGFKGSAEFANLCASYGIMP